jgi:hypothetical protein
VSKPGVSGSRPIDALEAHGLGGPQPVAQRSLPEAPDARLRAIASAIETVVGDSYIKHPMRQRTDAEDTRRATICTRWFNCLVNERRWTPDQALSGLRYALDDELSGGMHPLVTKQTMWAPDKALIAGMN